MVVYFNNDGSYGKSAINIPVLVNGNPIGFVSEIDEERVACYLWDRFIDRKQIGVSMYGEQDICSIEINN